MSKSAVILCLNGRRRTVKFTPNSTVAQIIEDVCAKESIDPAAYDLKGTRNILDRTLPWRYTNLPNNAKLELHPRDVEQDMSTTVKIAIQLPDGQRISDEFSINTMLNEIVKHFSIQLKSLLNPSVDDVPSIIYMRQKLTGISILSSTSLQKLGIIKGSALLRFSYASQSTGEPSSSQDIASSSKTTLRSSSSECSSQEKIHTPSLSNNPKRVDPISSAESNGFASSSVSHDESFSNNPVTALAGSTTNCCSNTEDSDSPSTLEHKTKGSKVKRKAPKTKEIPAKRTKVDLAAPGNPAPEYNLINFKFPEATKGVDLLKTPPQNTNTNLLEACSRKAMLFNETTRVSTEESIEESDEFFEVTIDDLRKMMADLKHERKKLEEQEMLTDEQRKLRSMQLAAKYPCIVIRIVFPNRLILQGLFRPLETVKSLYEFVEEHLDVRSFYLFTTPPKRTLTDKQSSLFENNLAPAARIYFGCNGKLEEMDRLIKESSSNIFCTAEQANNELRNLKV